MVINIPILQLLDINRLSISGVRDLVSPFCVLELRTLYNDHVFIILLHNNVYSRTQSKYQSSVVSVKYQISTCKEYLSWRRRHIGFVFRASEHA